MILIIVEYTDCARALFSEIVADNKIKLAQVVERYRNIQCYFIHGVSGKVKSIQKFFPMSFVSFV